MEDAYTFKFKHKRYKVRLFSPLWWILTVGGGAIMIAATLIIVYFLAILTM